MKIPFDPFNLIPPEERDFAEQLMARYQGGLTPQQISDGIAASLDNASSLRDDASLLASAARWGRAMSLLIASMEEIGKVSVLCSMARIPRSNQALWADAWKNFRSHDEKSTWAFTQTFPDEGRAHPAALVKAAIAQRSISGLCERLRQAGLYVDIHASDRTWMSPADIKEGDVEQWFARVDTALERLTGMAALGLYSPRALEIQSEVYAEFNKDRPRRKDLTSDNVTHAMDVGPELARQYFARLIQEGILPPDIDLSVGEVIDPNNGAQG